MGIQIPTRELAILRAKRSLLRTCLDMFNLDILKATQLGAEQVRCRCRLGLFDGGHWHHLPNTIEPSVCGGDVALCQITLTTCFLVAVVTLYLA